MDGEPTGCQGAALVYRRTLDWPCTAAGYRVWTLAGEAVDAVDLPEPLGRLTMSALRGQRRPHSVVAVPGEPPSLRFLIRSAPRPPYEVVRRLAGYGGRHLCHATLIDLPPTRVTGGELSWAHGPTSTVPRLTDLVATLAMVTTVASVATAARERTNTVSRKHTVA